MASLDLWSTLAKHLSNCLHLVAFEVTLMIPDAVSEIYVFATVKSFYSLYLLQVLTRP